MPDQENDQNNHQTESGSLSPALLVALGVGFLALAAGLYAVFGGTGKPSQTVAGTCSISDTHRAALDAAATGHMASFQVVDKPVSITNISFKTADGADTSIADWKGRTMLLNLWATWCAPCREEMPALDALEKDLGSEKFEVVPISLDLGDDVKPKGFYEQIKLQNLPFFHDGTLDALTTLKKQSLAFGLPATLLVDKKGCVLGTLNGPAEWASPDAKNLIGVALAEGG